MSVTRALILLAVLAAPASANTPVTRPEAIEVDRDTTPPGQAEMGFDGGAPIGDFAFGLTLTELERPLRLHTIDLKTYPVKRRETATLGGAIALGDDVIVDAKLPLSHQVGRRYQNLGDDRLLERALVVEAKAIGPGELERARRRFALCGLAFSRGRCDDLREVGATGFRGLHEVFERLEAASVSKACGGHRGDQSESSSCLFHRAIVPRRALGPV